MLNLEVKNAVRDSDYPDRMVDQMGERIRQLRVARDMTQERLGELCGVTKGAVSQWESGSSANIRLETFLLLADALGTDPHYLVWGSERGRAKPPARPPQRRFSRLLTTPLSNHTHRTFSVLNTG